MPRYGLPASETDIQQDVDELCDYWLDQKDTYRKIQEHLARKHKVKAPGETLYDVRKLNLGRYRAHLNERLSRFMPVPRIRVIPDSNESDDEAFASRLEKGIAEMRRQLSLTNDSWGLALTDVLTAEEGWELYEPAIKSAWPELIPGEGGKDAFEREMGATEEARAARQAYKAQRPLPVTSRYVPLSNILAVPDHNLYEVYETESRPLRSVLSNTLFDAKAREAVRKSFSRGPGIKQEVTILNYCNCDTYAIYAIGSTQKSLNDNTVPEINMFGITGVPILLHSYTHNIGENLYNPIFGAHGGWLGQGREFIQGRINTLLDLETELDTLFSQGLTNVGETFWPTMVVARTMDRPGSGILLDPSEAELVDGIKRRTGHDLNIFTGESVSPMFEAKANPLFESLWDKLNRQFDMIAGSSTLFGIHQPGVETGYAEENLRTQSESQYARQENGIGKGAITGTIKALAICRETGEDLVIRQPVRKNGRSRYDEIIIRSADIETMPVLDAAVRAPRPIDLPVQLRAYKDAVSPVNGPGSQAMSERQARISLLGDEHPDDTSLQIKAEEQEKLFWASEIPQQIMKEKFGLAQLSEVAQSVQDDATAAMEQDPGMASQLVAYVNGEAPVGPNEGMGQGTGGGLPANTPQPEQAYGREQQIMEDNR